MDHTLFPDTLNIDLEIARFLAGDLLRGSQVTRAPEHAPSGDPTLAEFEAALSRALAATSDAAMSLSDRARELAEDSRRAAEAIGEQDRATARVFEQAANTLGADPLPFAGAQR